MDLTVEIAGEDPLEVTVPSEATYADILDRLDVNPHTVSIVVEGRPVPETAAIEDPETPVRVVRLIKGG